MPLPDATPDKRIYELLKTVDLENLTFSDLQAVGQSIYAEQGAEDELRRLVLLNLARLSVVGEWSGLTTAGGGGSGGMPLTQVYPGAVVTGKQINYPSTYWLADSWVNSNNWCANNTGGNVSLWPFTGGPGGDPSSILLNCTATGTGDVKVAIYNVGTNNEPTSILAQANLGPFSTTGVKSWSPTITLEQDKLYYFAIMSLTSTARPTLSLATDTSTYSGWGSITSVGASPINNQASYQYNTTVSGTFDDPAPRLFNAPFYDGTMLMSLVYPGTA